MTKQQPTRTPLTVKTAVYLACAGLNPSLWAQSSVYRCEQLYSSQPCAQEAIEIQVPSAPTTEQIKARDQLTQQEQRQAQTLEQKRLQDDVTAAQNAKAMAQTLENQHPAKTIEPAPSLQDQAHVTRKKRHKKPSPYFTAKPPSQQH